MGSIVRQSCIFCKIVDGIQKTDIIYSNESAVVFRDIRPAAKNHILSVSREHIKDVKTVRPENNDLIRDMIEAAKEGLKVLGDDLSDVRFGFHWPPFHSISHLHLHAISPASEMSFLSRMIFRENSYWFVSPDYVLSK